MQFGQNENVIDGALLPTGCSRGNNCARKRPTLFGSA
jgi:hypothetical protein